MQETIAAPSRVGLSIEQPRRRTTGQPKHDRNEEAVSFGPSALVDREVLVELSRLRPIALISRLVFDYSLIAEHYPENEFQRDASFPRVFRTRDIMNSWFDSFFLVTRGVNYHLAHHLCPQVPFYGLTRLQRELAKSDVYRRYAHVTHGYHRFFWEYFFQRSQAVGFLPNC